MPENTLESFHRPCIRALYIFSSSATSINQAIVSQPVVLRSLGADPGPLIMRELIFYKQWLY